MFIFHIYIYLNRSDANIYMYFFGKTTLINELVVLYSSSFSVEVFHILFHTGIESGKAFKVDKAAVL